MTSRSSATLFILLALVAAGSLFNACNDNPTALGSGYLPGNVEFRSYTLRPDDFIVTSGIAVSSNSSTDGVAAMLVGSADDSTRADALVAITAAPPKVLQGSGAKPITRAILRLKTYGYSFGDSSRQAAFDVVVLDEMFPTSVQRNDDIAAKIASAPVLGTFSGTFPDSASTIEVELNTAATSKFLQEYFRYDTAKPDTVVTVTTLKSLALRAHNDTRSIVSLVSATFRVADTMRPTLRLTLGDTTANTTVDLIAGISTWIAKSPAAFGNDRIVAAGGVPIRTYMRFRLDSIPNTATIHQAQLTLHVDPAGTRYGSTGATTYMMGYAGDRSTLDPNSYLTNPVIRSHTDAFRIARDASGFTDTFRFISLAPFITAWLRTNRGVDTVPNNGIIVALSRGTSQPDLETATVDRISFYGKDAPDSLRPSMTIIYSIQTNAQAK
jgi:hypothetical protein